MDCTPRIAFLANRLQELSAELNKNLDTLSKKLGISDSSNEEPVIILDKALHNIQDRQKDKEALKQRLKIEVQEILIEPIEYSELSDPDFSK